MSKQTQGPWTNEESEITAEDGSVIAHVNTVDDFPCIGEDNDPEQMSHLVAELEANARLIAAAPELLEAAWRAIELINRPRNEGVFEARAILAAAIAKAEGGA